MGYAILGSKSTQQLQTLIRRLSLDTAAVVITIHASARMKKRRISRAEVYEILRHGMIRRTPEPDPIKGSITCRMDYYIGGRNLAAIVALADEQPNVVVVTVLLN